MRSATRVAPRALLLGSAAFAVFLLASWQHDEDRCRDAVAVIFSAQGPRPPGRVDLDGAIRTVRRSCNPERVRGAAAVLVAIHDPRAASLARQAARRQPDDFRVWTTLATALENSDPAGAERARRRAIELNPLLAPRRGQ